MEEKVFERELMTEQELKQSRVQRDVLDFLLSPLCIEMIARCVFRHISSYRR